MFQISICCKKEEHGLPRQENIKTYSNGKEPLWGDSLQGQKYQKHLLEVVSSDSWLNNMITDSCARRMSDSNKVFKVSVSPPPPQGDALGGTFPNKCLLK